MPNDFRDVVPDYFPTSFPTYYPTYDVLPNLFPNNLGSYFPTYYPTSIFPALFSSLTPTLFHLLLIYSKTIFSISFSKLFYFILLSLLAAVDAIQVKWAVINSIQVKWAVIQAIRVKWASSMPPSQVSHSQCQPVKSAVVNAIWVVGAIFDAIRVNWASSMPSETRSEPLLMPSEPSEPYSQCNPCHRSRCQLVKWASLMQSSWVSLVDAIKSS
jgi:hypothetical protein